MNIMQKGFDINGIIFFIKSPNGLLMKEEIIHTEIGTLSFYTTLVGQYDLCYRTNRNADWRVKPTDANELEMRIDILVDDLMPSGEFESKSRIEAITNMIASLTAHMQSVQKQMEFTRAEDEAIREIYAQTTRRMWWGYVISFIALILCGVYQVRAMKRVMIQKKLA